VYPSLPSAGSRTLIDFDFLTDFSDVRNQRVLDFGLSSEQNPNIIEEE